MSEWLFLLTPRSFIFKPNILNKLYSISICLLYTSIQVEDEIRKAKKDQYVVSRKGSVNDSNATEEKWENIQQRANGANIYK